MYGCFYSTNIFIRVVIVSWLVSRRKRTSWSCCSSVDCALIVEYFANSRHIFFMVESWTLAWCTQSYIIFSLPVLRHKWALVDSVPLWRTCVEVCVKIVPVSCWVLPCWVFVCTRVYKWIIRMPVGKLSIFWMRIYVCVKVYCRKLNVRVDVA